ncbi:MAG: M64 family metallopeptidase [Bdellovibrionales bacterium]
MKLITILLFICSATANAENFKVKSILTENNLQIPISIESLSRVTEETVLRDLPLFFEGEIHSKERYVEKIVSSEKLSFLESGLLRSDLLVDNLIEGMEIRTLKLSGPASNRINLPIVAEGYTLEEKENFFTDANRIYSDLFKHEAFSSFLNLFNVYAIFVPSNESGVSDFERKDTAFGSYRRPAGSKRGIMPGDTRYLERVLKKAPGDDYPILLVNDDYYGGLGGRYAVTTRSLNSGSMVLRHELGHNFGNVGEEYDGGYVYQGANFDSSSRNIKWSHWLAEDLEVYGTKILKGAYVWKNLNGGSHSSSFTFNNPRGDQSLYMLISSVGWETPDDVKAFVNGQPLELKGVFTKDRSFFKARFDGLNSGSYQLKFVDNNKDGDNVLAFARIYSIPKNINTDKFHIAAYPVHDVNNSKRGFRPTFDTCLMRDMRSDTLCRPDKENMWVRFLNKVDLIDGVTTGDSKIQVQAPQVEGLSIELKNLSTGEVVVNNSGSFENLSPGSYKVSVQLTTPEVRKPSTRFTRTRNVTLN